jgi:hypothetical protein
MSESGRLSTVFHFNGHLLSTKGSEPFLEARGTVIESTCGQTIERRLPGLNIAKLQRLLEIVCGSG